MTKMVPLAQAEEVLKIKLADLLSHPEVTIHIKKTHGQTYVDPQELMAAKHAIEQKKGEHGKT